MCLCLIYTCIVPRTTQYRDLDILDMSEIWFAQLPFVCRTFEQHGHSDAITCTHEVTRHYNWSFTIALTACHTHTKFRSKYSTWCKFHLARSNLHLWHHFRRYLETSVLSSCFGLPPWTIGADTHAGSYYLSLQSAAAYLVQKPP